MSSRFQLKETIDPQFPDCFCVQEVKEEFLFHVQLNEVFQRIDLVYWGCQFFWDLSNELNCSSTFEIAFQSERIYLIIK